MAIRKTKSIPRQLLLLLGMAGSVTVAAAALYYFTSGRTFQDSAALTTNTVAKLNRSYDLLERISGDMNSLQQLLRQDDPDVIEKSIQNLETSQQQSATLIADCGEAGAGVKAKFASLAIEEKSVVDQFVKGQNALAYEGFLRKVSPQGSAVLDEIRQYHQDLQTASQQELENQQNRMKTQLRWRSVALGLVLVFVLMVGWRLKNRIASELLAIASDLAKVSESSANAAGQVSSSSQSLAEGASEQAASLEETSASLEEMSSMTKRNAENAQKANDLAKQARSAADKGVGDMQTMSAAMNAIKISSNDIAKIIKTIDEIAFQTNILALNAAVEAARAGEAGMGFAVVADEVRNLAQRSAQAAKETAAKIEGAIGKSAQGVEISNKVAQRLNEIVTKIRQVDELVAEVAGASREQTQGITQINTAVGQMDQVTQSNAASAEESAAAAEELNAQAAAMKESVAELLRLVEGDRQTFTTKTVAPSLHIPNSCQAAPAKKQSAPIHRNGQVQAKLAATGVAQSRSEIPLDGDFKDF
jgi:methyl-accepting chemotaxis protein